MANHNLFETIEIQKYINRGLAINRDTGDISTSPIYNNLTMKDSNKFLSV